MRHRVAVVRTTMEVAHVTMFGDDAEGAVEAAKKFMKGARGLIWKRVSEDESYVYVGEYHEETVDVRAGD